MLGSYGSRNNDAGAGGFGKTGISGEQACRVEPAGSREYLESTKGYNAYASGSSSLVRPGHRHSGKSGAGKAFTVQKAASLDYSEETVRHQIRRGNGEVHQGRSKLQITVVLMRARRKCLHRCQVKKV